MSSYLLRYPGIDVIRSIRASIKPNLRERAETSDTSLTSIGPA